MYQNHRPHFDLENPSYRHLFSLYSYWQLLFNPLKCLGLDEKWYISMGSQIYSDCGVLEIREWHGICTREQSCQCTLAINLSPRSSNITNLTCGKERHRALVDTVHEEDINRPWALPKDSRESDCCLSHLRWGKSFHALLISFSSTIQWKCKISFIQVVMGIKWDDYEKCLAQWGDTVTKIHAKWSFILF